MKKTDKKPDLIMSGEAARLLDIDRRTLLAWVKRGLIKPWLRLDGGERLYLLGDVLALKKAS